MCGLSIRTITQGSSNGFTLWEKSPWPVMQFSEQMVAKIGQDGFEPPSKEPRPFAPDSMWDQFNQDRIIFWDGKTLRYFSLGNRSGIEIPLPGGGPIYGIGAAYYSDAHGSANVFGVTLRDRLMVYDGHGALVASLPYHQDVERWGALKMGINSTMDRFYLQYDASSWIDEQKRRTMTSYLKERNRQGEVLRAWTLPPLPPYQQEQPLRNFLADRLQSPAFFFGSMGYQKIGALAGSKGLAEVLEWRFGDGWK